MLSDKLWDKFFDLLLFVVAISLFFIAPMTQILGVIPADSRYYEPKLVDVKHYTKVEDRGILVDKYNVQTKNGKTLTLAARVVRENKLPNSKHKDGTKSVELRKTKSNQRFWQRLFLMYNPPSELIVTTYKYDY
ncbi:hypothetical protein [Ligilactobacillus salivarius]|uniref:hypothetical protein n=1 Tax=Ligilactobacillus salivarius TaxID=1624 RepID=UPI0009DB1AED|nr:hypothetical protein [Ligilactobacillus salivarius]OQR18797.1 hypothetical protein B6U39_09320 [Ligilactobacillus salivarius]